MQIDAYLNFDGRCEEALEFYKEALGAKVTMLVRFKEAPEPGMISPGSENKVMHANLKIGDSTLLLSDGRCTGQIGFQGFSLSIAVANEAEGDKVFAALSDGGNVTMPLDKTFFATRFGMVVDRFGVSWMVIVAR